MPTENLLGPRIAAGLIDILLLFVLGAVLSAVFGETGSGSSGEGLSLELSGTPFIAYVIACFGYFFVFEAIRGQTPGKMALKLQVTGVNGPLTLRAVAVRTLLRLVDGLPYVLPNLVAVIAIAASEKHQRLGDMAAGTIVIRDTP